MSTYSYTLGSHQFLKIEHLNGKLNITAALLGSPLAFDDFCEGFASRLRDAGNVAGGE